MWIILSVIALITILLFYGSYSIQHSFYLKSFCSLRTKERLVSLSFDDGIDPIQTPKVLDVLKEYNIKAIFFIIGKKIEGNEEILERIVNEGHLVGNHSYSHLNTFPLFTYKKMQEDVWRAKNLLDKYSETQFFRPPFGITNPTVAKLVRNLGYISIGWSIRTFDTNTDDIDKVFMRFKKKLRTGDIILLHDRLKNSDILVRKIIIYLTENRYKLVRVDELIEKSK